MTNMAAEVGAFTGIIAPDEKTVEYLVAQRGMTPDGARARCARGSSPTTAPTYVKEIEIDAASIRPMIALPGDPGNGIYIDELPATVKIDIAYAGSLHGGQEGRHGHVREGVPRGARARRAGAGATCAATSSAARRRCSRTARQQGYDAVFAAVGATLIEPSCGACINAGPGVSRTRDEVTISAINRNFPGRSGRDSSTSHRPTPWRRRQLPDASWRGTPTHVSWRMHRVVTGRQAVCPYLHVTRFIHAR